MKTMTTAWLSGLAAAGAGCTSEFSGCDAKRTCPKGTGGGETAGAAGTEDCNDDDDAIYPGAPELCDGVDSDCDEKSDKEEDEVVFPGETETFVEGSGKVKRAEQPSVALSSPDAADSFTGSIGHGAATFIDGSP